MLTLQRTVNLTLLSSPRSLLYQPPCDLDDTHTQSSTKQHLHSDFILWDGRPSETRGLYNTNKGMVKRKMQTCVFSNSTIHKKKKKTSASAGSFKNRLKCDVNVLSCLNSTSGQIWYQKINSEYQIHCRGMCFNNLLKMAAEFWLETDR